MSVSWTDPESLEGDELTRWYLRSPADIEQERQAAAAKRYQDFFYGPSGTDPDPGFAREMPAADHDVDPDFAVSLPSTSQDVDPGFTWVPAGPNRFRSATDGPSADPATPALMSYSGPTPAGDPSATPQYQDAGPSVVSALELAPQMVAQSLGELRTPPSRPFGSSPLTAAQARPRPSAYGGLARSPVTSAGTAAAGPGHRPAPASGPRVGQTISYGALPAPVPSDKELADLRRQQAAFADTTRKIDVQNSLYAVPELAPAVVALGLGAAGEWATGEVAPAAGRAVANFVERDPYLRVGDNWATRAGRRAHAALKERLAQKPGWEYEPKLPREGQRPLKPDMGTPKRNPIDPDKRKYIELKPDSPSGRAAGARALQRYREVTNDPVRLLFYTLKDFI